MCRKTVAASAWGRRSLNKGLITLRRTLGVGKGP